MEVNSKQNKKVTIFACILSALSIAILVGGFMLVSSSKVVMLQSLSNIFSKVNNLSNNDYELINKIATSDDIGIRGNIASGNNKISFNYLENKLDKKSLINADLNINNVDVFGTDFVLSNDNLYFSLDNITDKFYYTYFKYQSFITSLDTSDSDKIKALLKEAITDYIDNKDITKTKTTIKYQGKDKKVNKLKYEFTTDKVTDIYEEFLKSLKLEDSIISNLAKIANLTKEDFISKLNSSLTSMKNTPSEYLFDYNVYYYGFNKIVQYEIADKDSDFSIKYIHDGGDKLEFYSDGITFLSLYVTDLGDKFNFTGSVSSEDSIIKFNGTKGANIFDLTIDTGSETMKISTTINKLKKENSYLYSYNIKLMLGEYSIDDINIDVEYYFGEKVNIDLNNATDVNDMTENELINIQNKILELPIVQEIMNLDINNLESL